jgi:hypothetical protein
MAASSRETASSISVSVIVSGGNSRTTVFEVALANSRAGAPPRHVRGGTVDFDRA